MPQFVFLWTDFVLWLVVLGVAVYAWRVRGNRHALDAAQAPRAAQAEECRVPRLYGALRMLQIRIHGRGGQGVVSAAEMLSLAAEDLSDACFISESPRAFKSIQQRSVAGERRFTLVLVR